MQQKENVSTLTLPYKTAEIASNEALKIVEAERTGEQYGLYCEYHSLNVAMGKYFRFNIVNLWAGLSGHGKSYLINILSNNFLKLKKGELNANVTFIPIVLHFCLEMSAYNEILRDIAKSMKVSYEYLLSSSYNKETKDYNRISEDELIKIKAHLTKYSNKNILFFEEAGNVNQIYNTVHYFAESYKAKEIEALKNNRVIKYKFIVNIDHTLLIENFNEKSNLELMSNVGKIAIKIRKKFDSMVNLLGQLNNNIEDVRRLTTPALHYPQKSDIYAQGQLFNACDNVFVIHQPQLLKLSMYGINNYPTLNLVHLLKLKSRHGKVGSIWFTNDLDKGGLKLLDMNKVEDEENLEDFEQIPEVL